MALWIYYLRMDLYHHILEMPLDDVDRGMSPWSVSIAAIVWTVTSRLLVDEALRTHSSLTIIGTH